MRLKGLLSRSKLCGPPIKTDDILRFIIIRPTDGLWTGSRQMDIGDCFSSSSSSVLLYIFACCCFSPSLIVRTGSDAGSDRRRPHASKQMIGRAGPTVLLPVLLLRNTWAPRLTLTHRHHPSSSSRWLSRLGVLASSASRRIISLSSQLTVLTQKAIKHATTSTGDCKKGMRA